MININKRGFTMIELLVVITIIGIIVGIATFALQGGQRAGRDTKRKSDIEQIRSSLELYRSSCRRYPNTLTFNSALVGDPSFAPSCDGTFMQNVPQDVAAPARRYSYVPTGTSNYKICAALEDAPTVTSDVSGCNCGVTCNYAVTSP